jgi:hypothetical protein
MPSNIPNTGPPISGTQLPRAMAIMPTTTASASPYRGEGDCGAESRRAAPEAAPWAEKTEREAEPELFMRRHHALSNNLE